MLFRLILLFTITPVVELYLLIRLGSVIGAFATILLVLGTGIVGAALARTEGFAVLQKLQHRMNHGEFPAEEMIDGLCILIAGVVLITPGIITDLLGFLLLLPPTRAVLKRAITRYLRYSMDQGTVHFTGTVYRNDAFDRSAERIRPARNPETTFVDDGDHDDPDTDTRG